MSSLIERQGTPDHIRSDNGSEFIEKGLRRRLAEKRNKTYLYRAGKPMGKWINRELQRPLPEREPGSLAILNSH